MAYLYGSRDYTYLKASIVGKAKLDDSDIVAVEMDRKSHCIKFLCNQNLLKEVTVEWDLEQFDAFESVSSMCCQCNKFGCISFKAWYSN